MEENTAKEKMEGKLMEKREEVKNGVQEIFKDREIVSEYVRDVESLKVSQDNIKEMKLGLEKQKRDLDELMY